MFKYIWVIILVMLNIGVAIDAIKAKEKYQNDFDFDALEDAGGDIYKVTNEELHQWQKKFIELEGIDIHNAAGVAVASLAMAVADGTVGKDDVIMLNITGAGEDLAKSEDEIFYAEPHLVLDPSLPEEEIISEVENLFK